MNCLAPTATTVRAQRNRRERYRLTRRVIPSSPNRMPAHIAPLLACWLVGPHSAGLTGQVFYAAAGEVTDYSPPEPRPNPAQAGHVDGGGAGRRAPGGYRDSARAAISPFPACYSDWVRTGAPSSDPSAHCPPPVLGVGIGLGLFQPSRGIPTIPGHGSHLDGCSEELADLGGVFHDVQGDAADEHSVEHPVVSVRLGQRPGCRRLGESVKLSACTRPRQ